MIDIHELIQGSHILYGDAVVEVEDIGRLNHKSVIVVDCDGRTVAMPESVEPIPITEELLGELGFRYNGCWNIDLNGLRLTALRIVDDWAFQLGASCRVHFNYLHQLENFIYLTTKCKIL